MDTYIDKKIRPLADPVAPEPFVSHWLHDQADGDATKVRVLDVGCGRGDTVAWLCEQGFDAYGVEPRSEYLDNGAAYFADRGYGERLFTFDSSYPFPDRHFDIVLSVQVLEHVADIDALAQEVARVSRPGARGLHVLPGRWRPVEPHLETPPFHWLPKGHTQEWLLRLLVRLWPGEKVRQRPVNEWIEYAHGSLHYRTSWAIRASLERHGLRCDLSTAVCSKLAGRFPALPDAWLPIAAAAYRNFGTTYIETRLEEADACVRAHHRPERAMNDPIRRGVGAIRHPSRIVRRFRRFRERRQVANANWSAQGTVSVRDYDSYSEYVRHQASKLGARAGDISRYNAQLRDALIDRLDGGDWTGARVLCLAARLGGEVEAFRHHGAFAVGIDLNPGPDNPYVLQGDFHSLAFPDGCVDVVFTNSVDHALQPDVLAAEVARVLRPGGLLIVEAMDFDEVSPGGWEVAIWSTVDDLVGIFGQHGFTREATQRINQPWPGTAVRLTLADDGET